jgi:hypothetical protein
MSTTPVKQVSNKQPNQSSLAANRNRLTDNSHQVHVDGNSLLTADRQMALKYGQGIINLRKHMRKVDYHQ